jgi:uncharacterized ion transporter superfamily protein YfcC
MSCVSGMRSRLAMLIRVVVVFLYLMLWAARVREHLEEDSVEPVRAQLVSTAAIDSGVVTVSVWLVNLDLLEEHRE